MLVPHLPPSEGASEFSDSEDEDSLDEGNLSAYTQDSLVRRHGADFNA